MSVKRKVLLAAGGTGGHMFPAQSLAEILKSESWDVALMTDARGQKHSGRIPADPIIEVQAASISPRKPIQALKGALKLAKGVRQAKAFIREWKPDIVVGFGGYPAFPAMRAAQSMGLPTIIHEQNAVLGRVNRVFAAKATHVVSGFDALEKVSPKAHVHNLGNPVRAQIADVVPATYEVPTDTINLLAVGGSLGARILSQTIPKAIALLPEELRGRISVVQQTTESEVEKARNAYLLIPLAIAMDDHQTVNARSLERHGAADILPESEFTPESVANILQGRLNDSNWLSSAAASARTCGRPNAARDLAKLVIATATEG